MIQPYPLSVKTLEPKKLIALSLLVLVLASSSMAVRAQPEDRHKRRAERMLELAFSAMEKANETIDAAYTAGINSSVIDEAMINYTAGKGMLELANTTFHEVEANYTLASELALQAMHEFKAAIATIMEHWEEPPISSAVWRVLSGKIERAEAFLDRVTDLVDKARTEYPDFNFTAIDEKLSQARQHLEYATANVTALNVNMTAGSLGQLNKNLHQISAELKRMAHSPTVKGKRIAKFIEKPLTKFIEKARKLNATDDQLSEVYAKIEEAKASAAEGDAQGAMQSLKEAHQILREIIKELHKGKGKGQGQGQGSGKAQGQGRAAGKGAGRGRGRGPP